jgi:hypothetical protein
MNAIFRSDLLFKQEIIRGNYVLEAMREDAVSNDVMRRGDKAGETINDGI